MFFSRNIKIFSLQDSQALLKALCYSFEPVYLYKILVTRRAGRGVGCGGGGGGGGHQVVLSKDGGWVFQVSTIGGTVLSEKVFRIRNLNQVGTAVLSSWKKWHQLPVDKGHCSRVSVTCRGKFLENLHLRLTGGKWNSSSPILVPFGTPFPQRHHRRPHNLGQIPGFQH